MTILFNKTKVLFLSMGIIVAAYATITFIPRMKI